MPLATTGVWFDDCLEARSRACRAPVRFASPTPDTLAFPGTGVILLPDGGADRRYHRSPPGPRHIGSEAENIPGFLLGLDQLFTWNNYQYPSPRQRRPQYVGQHAPVLDRPQVDFAFAWDVPAGFRPGAVSRLRPSQPDNQGTLAVPVGITDDAAFGVWNIVDQPFYRRPPTKPRPDATADPGLQPTLGPAVIVDDTFFRRWAPRPRPAAVEAPVVPVIDDQLLGWIGPDQAPRRRGPQPRPGVSEADQAADYSAVFFDVTILGWLTDPAPARRAPVRGPQLQLEIGASTWAAISGGPLIVAGPYFVTAATIYAPGAVAVDVEGAR